MKRLMRWQLYERSRDSDQVEHPRVLMMEDRREDFISMSYFGAQWLVEDDLGGR
ncbi:hypothetical protein [Nocardia nova]|uniref:hypothetical protein n=1 Tax=Nocardia nova TaxID=37330 RepID=UPI00273A2CFD|nr:hypothetical protein [Nocardia nova]